MATMYCVSGKVYSVRPLLGKTFTPKELEQLMNGITSIYTLSDGKKAIMKLHKSKYSDPLNFNVRKIYMDDKIDFYGDVIIAHEDEI